MSIHVMSEVWQHSRQRGAKLLLLLAIADFANENGEAWPSIETLMARCRSRKRAVQQCIYALRDAGELSVRQRDGLAGGYVFQILFPPCAETCAPPAQKPAPGSAETCAGAAQKPAPLYKDELSIEEPSVEPSTEGVPQKPAPLAVALPAVLDTVDFKKAWGDWLAYRKERKPRLSQYGETSTKKQWSRLAKMADEFGLQYVLDAIDHSIAQNYQGIFPAKALPTRGGSDTPTSPRAKAFYDNAVAQAKAAGATDALIAWHVAQQAGSTPPWEGPNAARDAAKDVLRDFRALTGKKDLNLTDITALAYDTAVPDGLTKQADLEDLREKHRVTLEAAGLLAAKEKP